MPLNDSILKAGDDVYYGNAAPTIGTLVLAQFSAPEPERHNPVVYGADGLFFATHQSQHMYLRRAFPGEFDVFTTIEDYERRPMLWVLVTQMAPGYHEITPRWRGRAFWSGNDILTDQAVAEAVIKMSERGGLHLAEWYSYISDERIRNSYVAPKSSNSAVN